MINLKVEDGTVSFGAMSSGPKNVKFFTKGSYPSFGRKGGSQVVKSFLDAVLTKEQLQSAYEYAQEMQSAQLYYKHFYTKAGEILGCSPRNAIKIWNAAEYYTKIEPRKTLVDLLARRRRGRVSAGLFKELVECEEKLIEVHNDGLKNILPLVLYFKMLPHELRKLFGKAMWKKLAANSFHRNSLLTKNIEDLCSPYCIEVDNESSRQYLVKITKLIMPVRSTLLANNNYMMFFQRNMVHRNMVDVIGMSEAFNFIYDRAIKKMPMKNLDSFILRRLQRKSDHIADTYTMAEQLGEKFNIWKHDLESFETIHDEMHRKLQEIREKQMFSPDPIECLSEIPFKGLVLGDYSIELLQSRLDIHNEGKSMGHCVGSYADRVAGGRYLVYSIKKNGERISTLGLDCGTKTWHRFVADEKPQEQPGGWAYSQHYGRFNQQVKDPVLGFLTDICLSRLNGKEFVTEDELKEIELAMISFKDSVEKDQAEIDTLKFPVYNPESYKSVYDRNFK